MKKFFLLTLLLVGQCFAVNLTVTKIVKDHNLYIFEHKYMIQTSAILEGVSVGSVLNIDTNLFYGSNQWLHNVNVTKSEYVNTIYTDHYDCYGYYTHTSSYDNYAFNTYTYQYTFYPIGLVNRNSMDLSKFTSFVLSRPSAQPLFSYTSVFIGHEWLGDNIDMKTSYFPSSPIVGKEETLQWVLDELLSFEKNYEHRIYPIFDRNYPDLLAGVLHLSQKRKVFLFDHVNGLAIFQRQ